MRDQQKICREEWFKEHEAKVLFSYADGVQVINWQKPGTWNYGCRFIIHSQWLMVVGDLGEAVYQWGERITPLFLSGLDFHYFMGKCRASPVGSRFRMWDSRKAYAELQRVLNETHWPDDSHRKFIDYVGEGTPKEDFLNGLMYATNEGQIDNDIAAELAECGYIPDVMCVGHWVGLKMALAQLQPQLHPKTP